ncbi:hypothetical protein SDC9_86319 [bioreactor metagenome]|uniref:Uncharacterized protein n=1 Tax=bioreactor metagenome TaxID=1076179 RepID=A0A644ZFM4_9ZZZZ
MRFVLRGNGNNELMVGADRIRHGERIIIRHSDGDQIVLGVFTACNIKVICFHGDGNLLAGIYGCAGQRKRNLFADVRARIRDGQIRCRIAAELNFALFFGERNANSHILAGHDKRVLTVRFAHRCVCYRNSCGLSRLLGDGEFHRVALLSAGGTCHVRRGERDVVAFRLERCGYGQLDILRQVGRQRDVIAVSRAQRERAFHESRGRIGVAVFQTVRREFISLPRQIGKRGFVFCSAGRNELDRAVERCRNDNGTAVGHCRLLLLRHFVSFGRVGIVFRRGRVGRFGRAGAYGRAVRQQ